MTFPLQFSIELSGSPTNGDRPLFVRLCELISHEIRRGRLRAGTRLPGTRPLAEQLGVGRNTVVAAYAELAAEGWIETRPAGGSFVSSELPELRTPSVRKSAPLRSAHEPGFDFEARPIPHLHSAPPNCLALFGGTPDLRLFPASLLARAYRRALQGAGRTRLEYAGPFGDERLRSALATWSRATRGLSVDADQILITHGSQMALDLIARTLIRPGDRIGVEEVGYQAAWAAFKQAGAKLVFLPVDHQGLNVDALESVLERGALRALYVTPHHQYPTTASLGAGRRLRLLDLAARHRFAIIEDDYDHEFHYDGRPLVSLASADRHGVVLYVGTLAKVLAPGLRLGFIAAPRVLIETLGSVRFHVDRHGDSVTERAVAELIEDGEVARHARRMRRIYHARRDAFAELLQARLGDALQFEVPAGGMTFWARAESAIDTVRWSEAARSRGVAFTLGSAYFAPEMTPKRARSYAQCLRLGFSQYDEKELALAVERLALGLGDAAPHERSPMRSRRETRSAH